MSLAQVLIKLETLSLSIIPRMFLIFDDFEPRDYYKKDSYKNKISDNIAAWQHLLFQWPKKLEFVAPV